MSLRSHNVEFFGFFLILVSHHLGVVVDDPLVVIQTPIKIDDASLPWKLYVILACIRGMVCNDWFVVDKIIYGFLVVFVDEFFLNFSNVSLRFMPFSKIKLEWVHYFIMFLYNQKEGRRWAAAAKKKVWDGTIKYAKYLAQMWLLLCIDRMVCCGII